MPKVNCVRCNKKLFRSTGRVNENKKFGWSFYCSTRCLSDCRKKRKDVICENQNCGKKFEKRIREIEIHNYCSRSCAAKINNQKFPKRGPGLKICKLCSTKFKGINLYCTQQCARESRRGYTYDDLLKILQLTAEKTGRVPAKREMRTVAERCIRAFGTWNNAITAAGLKPNRSHDNRMYKRTNTKAKDGHICDSISEAIIDNWLSKNKIQHIRNVSYPESNHKSDWSIGENIFIEYFGLAKDSPRYNRSINVKKNYAENTILNLSQFIPKIFILN